MEKLIKYINQYTTLDNKTIGALERNVVQKTYSRNQFILKQGQICNDIWFIKSGMVRRYQNLKHTEKTIWVYFEDEMFISVRSYLNEEPSVEIFQACEESKIYSISRNKEKELLQYPAYSEFVRNLQKNKFACMDQFYNDFTPLTPKDKYEYLLKNAQKLIRTAKLGYVASIMGVTPETLSRIRAKI